MKKTFIIVFLLFFMWTGLKAGVLVLEAGSSWSYFRNEGGTSYPKPCLGAGFQFYPIPKFNGFWSIGLKYLRKKMVLGNKSWPANSYYPDDSGIWKGDIAADYSYFEFPLGLGYQTDIKSKLTLNISIGVTIAIPRSNYSKMENEKLISLSREERERAQQEFDYLVSPDVINRSQNINFGVSIFYSAFGIKMVYLHALETTQSMYGLTIKDYVDSFRILVCYRFKNFTSIKLKK